MQLPNADQRFDRVSEALAERHDIGVRRNTASVARTGLVVDVRSDGGGANLALGSRGARFAPRLKETHPRPLEPVET
jgi:hypothetical protein